MGCERRKGERCGGFEGVELLRSLLVNFLPLRAFQLPSAMFVVVLSMTGSLGGFAGRFRDAYSSAVISPTWLFACPREKEW